MIRRAALACLIPGAAGACALPASVILTLPTGHYMAGAAAVVALTALIAALAPRLPPLRAVTLWRRPVLLPETLTSTLSFLVFAGLVGIGYLGARDPFHNLLTLVIWTGVWVALPIASILFGDLWRAINPWTGPVRLIRTACGITGRVAALDRLGHWPAVLGLFLFHWFTLVSLSPEDPAVLARVVTAYGLVMLALGVVAGEGWLRQAEFLTLYLSYLSRIAPLWLRIEGRRATLLAGWPGTQVLALPPLPPSAIAFVTLALAGLTFDGLQGTFWWLDLIGQNPLEFAGRSAVAGVNTAGLLAVWALTGATILGAVRLGRMAPGPVMLSFLAIAAGYHGAHHLVTLLSTGQYTLAALNDPFFRGDAFLGLEPFFVSMGFLTDRAAMTAVWNMQAGAIIAAHVLAVVLSFHLAGPAVPARAHLALTVLMVGYTVLGLWMLAQPTGA